ncbi:MAG: hypothetical protein ACOYLQ_20355 [Hyphomicrobiaceae bacterium]|jgi:hypothetical protein
MWSLVKLAAMALAGYAVFTAPPQDQIAMAEGARALGRSLVGACTRPQTPCRQLIDALRPLAAELAQGDTMPTGDPSGLPRARPVR